RERARQAHPDVSVVGQHFFGEQFRGFAQSAAVVSQKSSIDKVGGRNVPPHGGRVEARTGSQLARFAHARECCENGGKGKLNLDSARKMVLELHPLRGFQLVGRLRSGCANDSVPGLKPLKPSFWKSFLNIAAASAPPSFAPRCSRCPRSFKSPSKRAAFCTMSAFCATPRWACRSSPLAISPSAAPARRRWWKSSRANCATRAGPWPFSLAATAPSRPRWPNG